MAAPSFRALLLSSMTALFAVMAGCAADGEQGDQDEDADGDVGETSDAYSTPAAAGPIKFTNACQAGTQVTIAAIGDVLLHSPLQQQAYAKGFDSLWKNVEPLLSRADLTYGNLEGPCAEGTTTGGTTTDPGLRFDGKVYSSYPQFNYNPALIPALQNAGFDVVSTANNHALDRRGIGADRTIANLKKNGLPFTGTRSTADMSADWYTITESKGVRVAWVACTFSTNGIPDPKNQVLSCYEDKSTLLSTITSLSKRSDVDAIMVTPHWGVEYQHSPQQQEKNLAHAMIDAGATAVLGNHPHVVQPMEKYTTREGREGFVIYSLGNFVSGQSGLDKQSSLILYVGLTKAADGKTTINGVRHIPLRMASSPTWTSKPATGDSLAQTTRLLGEWNRLDPDAKLVTNPECE